MNHQEPNQPLLSVASITKNINGNLVVRDVSFRQYKFQKIAIAGETGSGKSTLLKMIGGLVQPDTGKIYFEQRRVMGPDYQLVAGEAGIAYLSQHYELRNHHRMEELLSYANLLAEEQAREIYAICRIDHLLKRNTFQLSGGEKQRIALARLLVSAPGLLLLDEPFSNLDLIHKNILKSVIDDIAQKLSITCLLTSHDPTDTLSWAEEMIIMKDGGIVQQGAPQNIYTHPCSEYVAGLLGPYNIIDAKLAGMLSLTMKDGYGQILLRPQFITVSEHETFGSIPATVRGIAFHGTHYQLLINAQGYSITTALLSNSHGIGSTVYISVSGENITFIKTN